MEMTSKRKSIMFTLLITLAMIFSMFLGVPSVQAAAVEYNGQTTTGDYTIKTEGELRQLASVVNAGTTDYSGSTFTVLNNIALIQNWIPIGGQCALDANGMPVSGSKYFAGTFNGGGWTISGLHIDGTSITSSNNACYGLFGFVTGGIMNVTVDGVSGNTTNEINFGSNDAYAIGGVVGLTVGSVVNCHNNGADIWMMGQNGSNAGGVIGVVQNTTVSGTTGYSILVQQCSNTSNVTARGRVGGVVGAAYSNVTGNTKIDQCFNKGTIRVHGSSKAWTGGVVGYCKGYVSSCYNTGSIGNTDNYSAHYVSGVAGILNGSGGVYARMAGCYNSGDFYNCNINYDRQLYGSADNSSSVTIDNSYWITDTTAPIFTQPTTSTWGTCNGVSGVDSAATLNSDATVSNLNSSNNVINDTAFKAGTTTPALAWESKSQSQQLATAVQPGSLTGAAAVGETDGIFIDGVNGSDSNDGTSYSSAVKTLTAAIGKVSDSRPFIYISGKVTISGTETWSTSVIIKRSKLYGGHLIEVANGGNLTLSGVTIDGNSTNAYASGGSIVNILSGGSATVQGTTTLENNHANSGGAIRVSGGTLTMTGGTITNCSAISNGDGVYLYDGTFDVNPTTAFQIANTIYMAAGKSLTLQSSLSSITGNLNVDVADPSTASRVIANASSQAIAIGSVAKFTYVPGNKTVARLVSSIILQ